MNGNLIRIVAVSYGRLSSILRKIEPTLPANVQLAIVEGVLDEVKPEVERLESNSEVDIFLSSGGNARHLAMYAKTPIVEVEVTGFDFLAALKEARRFSDRVCVITNLQKIPLLSDLRDILRVTLHERTYNHVMDLDYVLDEMKEEGVLDIVGSSLIIERARMKEMRGHYIYSEHGTGTALTRAIQMASSIKSEGRSLRQMHGILKNTREGIISVDANGLINAFNPSAEKILGLRREQVFGRKCDAVLPEFGLMDTVANNREKSNLVLARAGRQLLTNQVPILGDSKTILGAVLTFHDIDVLQRADARGLSPVGGRRPVAVHRFSDILCKSNSMQHVKKMATEFAASDAPLLIRGDTGTGKDMFAHSVHNAGQRAEKPFVTVNCASLPRGEAGPALFGQGNLPAGGAFAAAADGTLYLDGIEELDGEIQGRLAFHLELLEEERAGGGTGLVRVIASTRRAPMGPAYAGGARRELYYRLNVLCLNLPGLAERQADIPPLMTHFLAAKCPDLPANRVKAIANAPFLAEHPWPGNVRELRNLVERFALARDSSTDHLRLVQMLLSEDMEQIDDNDILRALEANRGNKLKTAEALGISRTTLWRKLKELGVE